MLNNTPQKSNNWAILLDSSPAKARSRTLIYPQDDCFETQL